MSASKPVTESEAEEALRKLIQYIGDDPGRAGVTDTPRRVLKAWRESWGVGYQKKAPDELIRLFENPAPPPPEYHEGLSAFLSHKSPPEFYSQMVMVRKIAFFSHCEHHLAPFFGTASIGYIPDDRGIVGISKLARVTTYYSRRLQVQERLTAQVASFLSEHLSAHVAVTMEAAHMCMMSRGVQQANALTRTTALHGDFLSDPTVRAEFLQAAYAPA